MPTPRVAAIHDISGFGRCSMTIIMPALSVMGVQCCPLPTAYLSTHTGGFEGNTFLDLTDQMERAAAHWRELGLRFDAVYTGFMGSCGQAALAADCIRTFKRQENLAVVDPVMGDHGRLYRTYTPEMCAAVADMAAMADVITPNWPWPPVLFLSRTAISLQIMASEAVGPGLPSCPAPSVLHCAQK